jgi:hypothetical protein
MGWPPRESIERTDHMPVYGPNKPSSRLLIEACLFSTVSLAVVGKKLGMDIRISQPLCCELCRESFFSGVMDLFKSVDDYAIGCYTWTA